MTFEEALKKLDIEDYGDRIFNSNSRGDLYHLQQYIDLAEALEGEGELFKFRAWFTMIVSFAEEKWERPESVFQHIMRMFLDMVSGAYV